MPVLLLSDGYVVKTRRFRAPSYVGDPINSVKIFNEKRVDELVVLDISASETGRGVDFNLVESIVSEAFMPIAYGGGIRSLADAERLFAIGLEKVVLNTILFNEPSVVGHIASAFGRQAVVASIDVAGPRFGRDSVATKRGRELTGLAPAAWARRLEESGVGEILLTHVRHEGTRTGFALELIQEVAAMVDIPVIAHGGAGSLNDLRLAVDAGASAVAAGSLFVHHGRHLAVLLTYPSEAELTANLNGADRVV